MVAGETILLSDQYVQYVSIALCLTPKDTNAEGGGSMENIGEEERENLEILTSVKENLDNLFPWK